MSASIWPFRSTFDGRTMAWFSLLVIAAFAPVPDCVGAETTLVHDRYGAVVRGDVEVKQLALVFTGDEKGESTAAILDALQERDIKSALFVTGNFLSQPKLAAQLLSALDEGHYVGPHSDDHLLYSSWEDREKSLVTREVFQQDLKKNLAELRAIGALKGPDRPLFIAPYEWYNADQVRWAEELGVRLINFTPGSGSNRDYAPEGDARFVPSRKIYEDILAYEEKDPHGLNGFILLLHLGSGRADPFHAHLGALCDALRERGYEFVRVDALLGAQTRPAR